MQVTEEVGCDNCRFDVDVRAAMLLVAYHVGVRQWRARNSHQTQYIYRYTPSVIQKARFLSGPAPNSKMTTNPS